MMCSWRIKVGQYGPKSYNFNVNQPGASNFPRFSVDQVSPYKDGLVIDVILNESHPLYNVDDGVNIGMVKVRLIPEDRGVPDEKLNWIMPLDSSIREYPLKNEIVMVFYSIGRMFYTKRINTNNKITENSWPGLNDKFAAAPVAQSATLALAGLGGPSYTPWDSNDATTLGDEFTENPSVKMVRHNEGDTIIQGRFGNIIRFGSSLFSNPTPTLHEPNLLITVGLALDKPGTTKNKTSPFSLVYEDINKDLNCLWMVTDELVLLEPATINSTSHLRSSETSDSTKYTGAQIFINSNRLILNSKKNEISLFSKKEINLSAVESITVDSTKSVFISAENDIELTTPENIILNARSVVINSANDIAQGTPGNYIISGKKIFIGASPNDTTQPMVLGGELALWLTKLVQVLSKATVITSTGPAFFDPSVMIVFGGLLKDLGTPGVSATFNSTSNFTSKTN